MPIEKGSNTEGNSPTHSRFSKSPLKKFQMLVWPAIILFTAIAALLGFLFWPQPQEEIVERIPVVVADFVNESKEDELGGLSGMLITALEQSRRLSVLTRSRMFDALKQMGKKIVDRINETLGREICQCANVSVEIFDMLGKHVRRLVSACQQAGRKSFIFLPGF